MPTDHTYTHTQKEDLRAVIAGAGRVGLRTARVLDDLGHDVVVIDPRSDRVEAASDRSTATIIEGDATRPETLKQADLARSDVVAALTGSASENIAVCSTARHLDATLRTVARVESPNDPDDVAGIVDRTVFPERAGAKAAVNEILTDRTRTLEDVTGDLDVLDVRIEAGAPAANRELRELDLPDGSHVIADAEGRRVARPRTTLRPNERYLVAAEPSVVDDLRRLLTG